MSREPLTEPRWWQRIGVRVGITVAACVVIAEVLMLPLLTWVEGFYHPEVFPQWYEWDPVEFFTYWGVVLLMAIAVGSSLGWIVSALSMRRLERIALQAATTFDGQDELPGPFDEAGNDEITRLARALNGMRERVKRLVGSLAQRDARRSEWVAQVSHDLRTPLTALTTCLDHAADRLRADELDAAELAELVAAARIDAARVATLAEDLLEIARLEVDSALQTEPVLPGEIAEHTLRGLEPLAREAGIEIELEVEPGPPVLQADGRLICRALENLVLNSIQHARTWLRLTVRSVAGQVHFVVEDDGEGLPEEQGAVLFAALRRQRSRADSAGLGLIVTQRVAQAHGGQVGAENRERGGARIWIAIPVSAD